jgi:hypothetical protein
MHFCLDTKDVGEVLVVKIGPMDALNEPQQMSWVLSDEQILDQSGLRHGGVVFRVANLPSIYGGLGPTLILGIGQIGLTCRLIHHPMTLSSIDHGKTCRSN